MAGARVWYLPSVWFTILIALALDGLPPRSRYAVAGIALMFQFAALQHNLGFWEAVSAQVKTACEAGAPAIPDWIDGIPAMAEKRPDCIEIGRITRLQP